MDNDRTNAMLDIIAFLRSPMKAMSVAERDRVNTVMSEYPSITVPEIVNCWIETVYRNS